MEARPPVDMFLDESLPLKPPPPFRHHGHGFPVKNC